MRTIKFISGQTYSTPIGPVKVIRDRRSTFIWLYRGQKRLQGGLIEIINGQEIFTLKDGSKLLAGGDVEEVYCIDASVLPIDRAFKAIATATNYIINGVSYPKGLFIAF